MPQRIEMWKPARANFKIRRLENRPNAAARGYCDGRHKAWRLAVLSRDNWQCRACGRVCVSRRSAHADHISPVVPGTERCENGLSRYDLTAGQCLCAHCHSAKTARETSRRNK